MPHPTATLVTELAVKVEQPKKKSRRLKYLIAADLVAVFWGFRLRDPDSRLVVDRTTATFLPDAALTGPVPVIGSEST